MEKSGKISLKVVYTIDKEEEGWKGEVGFLSKDMIARYVPKITDDRFCLSCGPPPMTKMLPPMLKELGMTDNNYFKF
jgi:cytochrome-b5 reductase